MTATERFTEHVLETPLSALPDGARRAAKTFILDTIGVGVAGVNAPYADQALAAARRWGVPDVSNGAHPLGRRFRLPAPSAAFVSGFQIHCQEFDCVHEGAVVHPMATIFAALLAEAEARAPVSGEAMIAAVALAVDVAAGLGVASKAPIKFFRPANAGLFGATLGVARLRGFAAETAIDALGYALAHCSGTMQAHVEGKPALPIQIGNAARAALLACDLAEAGLPGPRDVFEGQFGFFPLFEGEWDMAPALDDLGRRWRITEVSHKPFPTGRAAQGGVVATQRLRQKGVSADALERLTLTAPPLIKRLVGRPYKEDMDANYARLCFPYIAARVLLEGDIGLDDFTEEALRSSEAAEIAVRIQVAEDGSTDPAAFTPQRAEAALKDGRTVAIDIDSLYGSPGDPMTVDAQREKFRRCLRFGLGEPGAPRADALIARIDSLEEEDDVAALARFAAGL